MGFAFNDRKYDELVNVRIAAKQRIIAAQRTGNVVMAEIWGEYAGEEGAEKALQSAIKYAEAIFAKELKLLTSIPEIGDGVATYLLAQLMPIDRFDEDARRRSHDIASRNLKRYVGMHPKTSQSGKINIKAKMSKSGNPI